MTARVWTHDDPEPPMIPDPPPMRDRYGVRWVADEREDGFVGWRSDSHGFRTWQVWWNLAFERGPLTEDHATSDLCPLTEAELDAVTLAACGLTQEAIARKLTIKPRTVYWRLTCAMTKLGTRNTTHTAVVCTERGWIKSTIHTGDTRESA